ncbi:NAD(P)-dependent malic enzyme [Vagococcus elongatus]|uniref:NAD-dependent malic enzyme n=1 Tax=Vagococcus elongatus TaxID=180344 RepID=A0A430B252_9ENTE|nr:malic enzyme-like NAD(P)-binding protein [Vagococcus elongatus]RSU14302.1 NAD-dependent malic enzyme [Vagococcus elongatus]
MTTIERALKMHEEHQGKISVESKVAVTNREELALAYTPGVAEPCKRIEKNPEDSYRYTSRGNLVGVVTDGSAVLGLGNIGPLASMPVMEGKSLLFKQFGKIDAFPVALAEQDPDKLVEIITALAPTFGGINLEDISAPKCFEIEKKLQESLEIPVFHDDQHGTAIVVAAGLINSLKIVNKKINEIKVVLNGPGAAGTAIIYLLLHLGVTDIIACDSKGLIYEGREGLAGTYKEDLAQKTNQKKIKGKLSDAIKGADVFIGVSIAGALTVEMVKTMKKDPIVFAMANPTPEIMPDEAAKAGVKVMGTGRSDFPNQINNVLAFPGIFRGAFDAGAKKINAEMKEAAVYAIAELIEADKLSPEYVIPDVFDERVCQSVAEKVAEAARKSGAVY